MQFIYLLLALALLNQPSFEYSSLERNVYDVQSTEVDSSMYYTILPYKQQLDSQMNEVLCYAASDLRKGKPESLLGNWTSDACLYITQEMTDEFDIDISFFNTGGLRSSLSEGDITKRDIYKLMPFENELVVLELDKDEFMSLRSYFIYTEGQPIAFSDNFSIEDSVFHVLTTDYLANGGDKMSFFNNKEQHKVGVKMRDALIDYCVKNDTISSTLDSRHLILFNDN
ncbi:5'-nucleotidase C-terminal domain-containing protein [Flavobacteriales bacterium]|jgi:2',3'-cyclic-nucleotide 2'-phosphodiesterase (5'-nucleotidase family)|nr:5'-nucleotidase C-terminal domain-containing protein [Flavobacteriales bacterium]